MTTSRNTGPGSPPESRPPDGLTEAAAACGIFNLRDLAGLPAADGRVVASGVLVRSDALHRADTPMAEALASLGVGLVVDLRTVAEVESEGRFPDHGVVGFVHHPLLDVVWSWADEAGEVGPSYLLDRYLETAGRHPDRFVDLLHLVVGSERAVALHCAAGKDRTGMAAAFLLAVAGIDEEAIIADYARTADSIPQQLEWVAANLPELLSGVEIDDPRVAGMWSAHPSVMRGFLDHLNAVGGAEAWALRHGASPGLIEAFRSRVLVAGR